MMQITDQMVERIRTAVATFTEATTTAEIPDMRGYFVTLADDQPLPKDAKRIVELGIDGTKYMIYTVMVED